VLSRPTPRGPALARFPVCSDVAGLGVFFRPAWQLQAPRTRPRKDLGRSATDASGSAAARWRTWSPRAAGGAVCSPRRAPRRAVGAQAVCEKKAEIAAPLLASSRPDPPARLATATIPLVPATGDGPTRRGGPWPDRPLSCLRRSIVRSIPRANAESVRSGPPARYSRPTEDPSWNAQKKKDRPKDRANGVKLQGVQETIGKGYIVKKSVKACSR